MSTCKSLLLTSLSSFKGSAGRRRRRRNHPCLPLQNLPSISPSLRFRNPLPSLSIPSYSFSHAPVPKETPIEDDSLKDTVEELLANADDVNQLMKMERVSETQGRDVGATADSAKKGRWFPYLDVFRSGSTWLTSQEVIDALDPYILDVRKERIRNVVRNRSYSVCLVVEGLTDFGNVSATFRSADALGFQSVHVISCDNTKRYRDNRHVSMGAEKWLDIELWQSTQECFKVLRSRGYRIATTNLGTDAVSVYDMDWSCPTAIVVGNENRGISDEALELADLHCSIPMKGMVDSFNVSVAAGILMHHAVCDRISRLGCHGDLTPEESQILLAEFSLRHRKSAVNIAHEYAKRMSDKPFVEHSLTGFDGVIQI